MNSNEVMLQEADIVCRRQIQPREPRVLSRDSRHTVVCDYGTVWITQGDSQDYVLTAGQTLTLAPADTVLITAMAGPAHIHCRAPSVPAVAAARPQRDDGWNAGREFALNG